MADTGVEWVGRECPEADNIAHNHRDGVVHYARADAEADNEHFDGKTTE